MTWSATIRGCGSPSCGCCCDPICCGCCFDPICCEEFESCRWRACVEGQVCGYSSGGGGGGVVAATSPCPSQPPYVSLHVSLKASSWHDDPPLDDDDEEDDDDFVDGGGKASSLSLPVTPESCSSSLSPHRLAHSSTALESTHCLLGGAHSSSTSHRDMARVWRDLPRPSLARRACKGPVLPLLLLLVGVAWAWSLCRIMCTLSSPTTRPSWSGVGVTAWRAGEPMFRQRDTRDDHWLSTRRRKRGDPVREERKTLVSNTKTRHMGGRGDC